MSQCLVPSLSLSTLPARACPRSWARQSEVKCRTPFRVSRCPQATTMRFHNRTADRQAHAGTLRLSGEKCVEDLIRVLRREPYPSVTNGDQIVTIVGQLRRN